MEKFKTIVAGIKKVAPRSDEFLYFVCRAIHAMEANNIDIKTGSIVGDGVIDLTTRMWKSASGLLPYINQNGDAFPESELLKVVEAAQGDKPAKLAYQSFIGRGLFVNHASDDAEKIRGIILDATWDAKAKGVDLLVACDKIAYPELARQIQAGYSNDVSMGTQVQESVCSVCKNVAKTDADYCQHVKTAKGSFFSGKPCYEVNYGLNFIEISVVATGADPKAKIRQVLAHLNKVIASRSGELKDNPGVQAVIKAESDVDTINSLLNKLGDLDSCDDQTVASLGIDLSDDSQTTSQTPSPEYLLAEIKNIQAQLGNLQKQILKAKGNPMTTDRKAYFQGTTEPDQNPAIPNNINSDEIRNKKDKQMTANPASLGGTDGMAPGDEALKKELLRASLADRKAKREALLKEAYFQGTIEPGQNPKISNNINSDEIRNKKDKQMTPNPASLGGTDGMAPGDEALKKTLLRARLTKASTKGDYRWSVLAGEKTILTASASDFYGTALEQPNTENPKQSNFEWVSSKEFGLNLIAAVRQVGLEKVKSQIATACSMSKKALDDKPAKEEATKAEEKKAEEKKKEEKKEVKAQVMQPSGSAAGAPGADLGGVAPLAPMEAGKEEEKEEGDVDVNINVGAEGKTEEAAGEGVPAEIKSAVQEVADELATAAEKLSSVIAGEDEEVGGDLEEADLDLGAEAGKEAIDTADELTELDKALDTASAPAPEGASPEATAKQAATRTQLIALAGEAVTDAKRVVANIRTFIAKSKGKGKKGKKPDFLFKKKDDKKEDKKVEKKATLEERKAARQAIAEKLYDLTGGDMCESEAHSGKGNTTAVPGHTIATQSTAHEAGEKVAGKNPTGKLTAGQTDRRNKVAGFVKAMETSTKADGTVELKPQNSDEKKKVDEAKAEAEAKPGQPAAKVASLVTAKADPAAASYYKELFNSDPEAKTFAADLTKDYVKASTVDLASKIKRAFKVALRQAKLGQIASTHQAVEEQVDLLTKMDETAFSAFAKAVENTTKGVVAQANTGLVRTAGQNNLAQGDGEVVDPKMIAVQTRQTAIANLTAQLDNLGWSTAGHR